MGSLTQGELGSVLRGLQKAHESPEAGENWERVERALESMWEEPQRSPDEVGRVR